MSEKIEVLDHGYVQLVETWGSDERIIEAARMSTAKGFQGWGGDPCPECLAVGRLNPSDGLWACGDSVLAAKACSACKGSGKTQGDEKLLSYLWTHKHATPFEMAGMIIEVQAPIFVFREWHRHRTQCLSGDTMISLVSPRGTTFKRTIREIYDLKHGGVADQAPERHRNGVSKAGSPVTRKARREDPWRMRILPNCQERALRVLDEDTGEFGVTRMARVWESGVQRLWRLSTQSGRSIRATTEHPFLTKRGWVRLGDLVLGDEVARMGKIAVNERPIPPSLRQGIGVWTSMMRGRIINPNGDQCYVCRHLFSYSELQLDHVVPVAVDLLRALDAANLKPICDPCHLRKTAHEQPSRVGMTKRGVRWDPVILIEVDGEEMTYDIEVDGDHHNYVANDLVVHNSFNELSARYTPLPDVNYVPSVERLMINAGGSNKQAGTVGGAATLTASMADAFQLSVMRSYAEAEILYQNSLAAGVPKELARIILPVGRYSRMRASANLRNWLGFLTLRMDYAAQFEIRQYANVVGSMIAERFPRTWQLFQLGRP